MRLAIATGLLCLLVSPALAGWQGYEWGQLPEDGMPLTLEVYGVNISVVMDFGKDTERPGLEKVSLIPPAGQNKCPVLEGRLQSIYGPGVPLSTILRQWRDEENESLVLFLGGGPDNCMVVYEPLIAPNQPGGL